MKCPECGNPDITVAGQVRSWRGILDDEPPPDVEFVYVEVDSCLECGWSPPSEWAITIVEEMAAEHITSCGPGLTITETAARCHCGWSIGAGDPDAMARLGYAALARIGVALGGVQ